MRDRPRIPLVVFLHQEKVTRQKGLLLVPGNNHDTYYMHVYSVSTGRRMISLYSSAQPKTSIKFAHAPITHRFESLLTLYLMSQVFDILVIGGSVVSTD